ncbi:hypothetical protein JKP88DRAFT_351195, partial [Tribonema minus]
MVLARRAFSDGASTSTSTLTKLRAWVSAFVAGGKTLWYEHKTSRLLRQKLRDGETLTGKERRLLRQNPEDIKLAIPLVVLFCVPVLGYAAPLIGLAFPRVLLPPQFWTDAQHAQFAQQAALELQITGQPKLLEYVKGLGGALKGVRPGMAPHEVAA